MKREEYLERVNRICRWMADSIHVNFGHDVNVGTSTLLFCYLDALGGYYAGTKQTDTTFRNFIHAYLHTYKVHAFEAGVERKAKVLIGGKEIEKTYTEILYEQYRNGFVHQVLCKASTAIQKNEPNEPYMDYFALDYMGFKFVVNLQWLVPDFLLGMERYRHDVHAKADVYQRFKARYDAILQGA